VPSVTLALCFFIGTDMYNMAGLHLNNGPHAVQEFDRLTEVDYVKERAVNLSSRKLT